MRHTQLGLLILVAFSTACATARVENQERMADPRSLARPPLMVVHDFATSAADVAVDQLGPGVATGPGDVSRRSARGRGIAAAFATLLVDKLNEAGVVAARAEDTPVAPMNALVIKGTFLTIDEGDQMARVIIGFGAGAREIRARVQSYQVTANGLRPIAVGTGVAEGNKRPGMALPVIGGAIWGKVLISAAVSGGVQVISESFGGMDREMDRLANLLTERAQIYYQERGWL